MKNSWRYLLVSVFFPLKFRHFVVAKRSADDLVLDSDLQVKTRQNIRSISTYSAYNERTMVIWSG